MRRLLALAVLPLAAACTTNSGMEATPTFAPAKMLATAPPKLRMAYAPYSDPKPPRSALNGGQWVIENVSPVTAYALPVRMSRVTLVKLPEGETVNKVLGGDVDGFVVEATFVENRAAVAITPALPGRQTNVILTTTGGAYNFMVSSTTAGRWVGHVDVRRAAPAKPMTFGLAPSGQYERLIVSTDDGPVPAWSPVEVWADATKMVARFAEPLPTLPGLYAGHKGEQVVNYRVQRGSGFVYLITDRRVTNAELRIDQETVRISAAAPGNQGWSQAEKLRQQATPSFTTGQPTQQDAVPWATLTRPIAPPAAVEIDAPAAPARHYPTI